VVEKMRVSERRVCRLLGQPRSTQRRNKKTRDDEDELREEIVRLACQYGRYGYRIITTLLRENRDGRSITNGLRGYGSKKD